MVAADGISCGGAAKIWIAAWVQVALVFGSRQLHEVAVPAVTGWYGSGSEKLRDRQNDKV